MERRKVQLLGKSTLAVSLPAEWAQQQDLRKGDELILQNHTKGSLRVATEDRQRKETEAVIHVDDLSSEAVEQAIIAQYVLGRRVIRIDAEETIAAAHVDAVYSAESQLMGLGIVEETPDRIAIRCSVDPEDFTLDDLLDRLEHASRAMRDDAISALEHGTPDAAKRAINREDQVNKIFVLFLRLLFAAHNDPDSARKVGLDDNVRLMGYRSIAQNIELAADDARKIAETVLSTERDALGVSATTFRILGELVDTIDEMMATSVVAATEADYGLATQVRESFAAVSDWETGPLSDLPEDDLDDPLCARVFNDLQQTAEYAALNAKIATNLALISDSEYVTLR